VDTASDAPAACFRKLLRVDILFSSWNSLFVSVDASD